MEWPRVTLKSITIDMQPGFACQPTDGASGIPQLRTNNVSPDGGIDLSETKRVPANKARIEKYSLKPGDVLFNNTNSPALVGKTAVFDEDGLFLFSNHMTRIRLATDIAEPRYVAHYLHWVWKRGMLRALVTQWVNQAAINRHQLSSIQLPLPSLSEQRCIVEILDQADRLRRLRAEADTKAERILPTLFIRMFGDPATNPMGWRVKPLGEIGELDRGRSRHRPRNDPALLGGSYPLIQTGDIANSGGRITQYAQTYSELGLGQSRMWPAGTLCITIAANIARTGVLEFDACFPDSVVGFVPGLGTTTEYVQFLLTHLREALERNAPQVAQRNINLKVLRSLIVPVPPIELQRDFSTHVRQHYDCRSLQVDVRKTVDSLFASTTTLVFSGDLTASWRQKNKERLLQEMDHPTQHRSQTVVH